MVREESPSSRIHAMSNQRVVVMHEVGGVAGNGYTIIQSWKPVPPRSKGTPYLRIRAACVAVGTVSFGGD